TDGGKHHVVLEYLSNAFLMTEPFQSSDGQNNPIELPRCQFSQASVDIAAQCGEFQSREAMTQLNLAAEAACSNCRAWAQGLERWTIGDEGIAWIFAFGSGAERYSTRELEWDILHAVDGKIDAAIQQRLVNFLREE